MDTLVIFDFDSTIIDVDSDPWVAEQLGASQIFDDLCSQMPWNDMMEVFMGVLHEQGKTLDDIEEALRCVLLQPPKIEAIKQAYALGCELQIVSDANMFFITTILDKHGVTNMFSKIHTNPSSIDENGRIHIKPFHPKNVAPHGCSLCPPNMCKGRILEDILSENQTKRIIYVGDGAGDYCPILRLHEWDYVLPREGYALLELVTKNIDIVKPSICPWSTPKCMKEILLDIINNNHMQKKDRVYIGVEANCSKIAIMPICDQSNEMVSITSVEA